MKACGEPGRRRLPPGAPRARRGRRRDGEPPGHRRRRGVPRQRGAAPRDHRRPRDRRDRGLVPPGPPGRRRQAQVPADKVHLFNAETGLTLVRSERGRSRADAGRRARRLIRPIDRSAAGSPSRRAGRFIPEVPVTPARRRRPSATTRSRSSVVDSPARPPRPLPRRSGSTRSSAPTARRGTRDVVGHPGAVAVLALDDDGPPAARPPVADPRRARDARDPGRRRSTSTTASPRTPTSPPAASSRRRPGRAPASWRKLAVFWTAPGFATELMHLYLATGLERHGDDRLGARRGRAAGAVAVHRRRGARARRPRRDQRREVDRSACCGSTGSAARASSASRSPAPRPLTGRPRPWGPGPGPAPGGRAACRATAPRRAGGGPTPRARDPAS